jgi:glycosyltransferase involved in cell wall biosynthesis
MTAADTVQLTIIVACRNEKRHIRQFMDSLLEQDMSGMTWEAIIADGMSGDGTREILSEYGARHPQLRIVDNPRGVVSPGLNTAIRAARGAIVIRMDAHTSYAPDYCRRCVAELERTGADNVGGPARTRAEGTRARAFAAAYHSPFSTGARFHDENYEGWIDTVPYGCWRKETLERLGLFDESLVRNQDDELNLRLTRAGGKIWQSPDIVSWYSPRATLPALFLQYFQYGFWKAAVVRKHRLPGSWRHLVPVTFVLTHFVLFAAAIVTAATDAREFALVSRLWLALVLTYAAANVGASVAAARKSGWATLPYLPAVFTVYHFSWGLGFLAGFRWFLPGAVQLATNKSFFTRISR